MNPENTQTQGTPDLVPLTPPVQEVPLAPPQEAVQPTPPVAVKKGLPIKLPKLSFSPKQRKRVIIIFVVVFVLLLLLLLLPSLIKVGKKIQPVVTTSPTPVASGSPAQILNPSQYADDEDIKDVETKINELDNKLKAVSLREETLRVPSLDWDVEFK